MPASALPRNCAESCLDFLLMEIVHKYTAENSNAKANAILETIGNRVGKQLVERCARGRPRMSDDLDAIKFLCKEFWGHVFQKQVDNLKTNHRGVYILQDNQFRWMSHLNTIHSEDGESMIRQQLLQQYLALPCGLIKGALTHLGVNCVVSGDPTELPLCSFTIKIV